MSPADMAAHEAASYVRKPVDRKAVIAEAMRLLESGGVVLPVEPSPLAIYDRLERGADGTGRVGFVAFKTAQRIVAEGEVQ
jgi:hypothetical protein